MAPRRSSPRAGRPILWLGGTLVVLLAALVLVATFDLVAWLLLGRSWAEVEEIQGLLMIWFGLLGAAYALAEGQHLAVELVAARLPAALRVWVDRFAGVAGAFFGLLVAVYAARLAAAVGNTLPATGWSASLQYLPAVVAGALLAVIGAGRVLRPADGEPGAGEGTPG